MKLKLLTIAIVSFYVGIFACANDSQAMFAFGLHRDSACLNQFYEAPCHFPPLPNPCAVPCRPPGLQGQSVPLQFRTACPSTAIAENGFAFGQFPYPIFRLR